MGRPLKWQSSPLMQNIVSTNLRQPEKLHWLDLQKAERYERKKAKSRVFYRHLGVVESLFDADGALFVGRADLHQRVHFEVKTTLDSAELQERIILAWTLMRHSHVLLSCRTKHLHDLRESVTSKRWTENCFVYDWPESPADAIEETRKYVIFVAKAYANVDEQDFFEHSLNTGRGIDAEQSLSWLRVMPFEQTPNGTVLLKFMPVLAHQITDGLTTYRWNNHFCQILDMNAAEIRVALDKLFVDEAELRERLPPAQEALYPRRSHNKARERWHWLLTRILRHVRRPPPSAFPNPLKRDQPLERAQRYPTKYEQVLNYQSVPPLNAGSIGCDLYGRPIQNMRRLCKEAGISIGSGSFTLVAMVMMQLEEKRRPDVPLDQRLPFVGSFPVNPRPFFSGVPTTGNENSCMLAFSDGVTLPFLPSDLDFVGRFRLLGRLAHKQLRQYQKRKRSLEEEVHLGSKSPSQLIPALYCSTLERMEGRAESENKAGVNVQGAFPSKQSATLATCGISSVGDISAMLAKPKTSLELDNDKDMVAQFKSLGSTVRPRDGEFLVGAIGTSTSLGFGVAFDASAIDEVRAQEWKSTMESIFDRDLLTHTQAKL